MSETIAAISTPFGEGAISVVRVSGPDSRAIAGEVFRGGADLSNCDPRQVYYGKIVSVDGSVIDQVVATVFARPGSYTGEDLVEFACHGGILVTREVLRRILDAGARPAEPGEFTRRAFVNGKLDLTQAEAVMDLIRARTDLALRSAAEQLEGNLGDGLMLLRSDLLATLAHVEAYIDFPEEDIETDTASAIEDRIRSSAIEVKRLLDTANRGRILREGLRTVITGPPNAGKSSLLNVLLGFERAIVNETAGTTRDTIEEAINIQGVPLRLVDTAGIRESEDDIEKQGIERTGKALESADLILSVHDGSTAKPAHLSSAKGTGTATIHLLNKADLPPHPDWDSGDYDLAISCTTSAGLDQLSDLIAQHALGGAAKLVSPVAINARHQSCLQRAATSLEAAGNAMRGSAPPEITAIELRSAMDAVGEIVGKLDTEDLLGEIFGTFCIGK